MTESVTILGQEVPQWAGPGSFFTHALNPSNKRNKNSITVTVPHGWSAGESFVFEYTPVVHLRRSAMPSDYAGGENQWKALNAGQQHQWKQLQAQPSLPDNVIMSDAGSPRQLLGNPMMQIQVMHLIVIL